MGEKSSTLSQAQRKEVQTLMKEIVDALLGGLELPRVVRSVVKEATELAGQAAHDHPEEALRRLRAMREVLDKHRAILREAKGEPSGSSKSS